MALSIQENSTIEELYTRANAFFAQNQLELAEKLYNQILSRQKDRLETSLLENSTVADIFHNLGMIAENRARLDEAIALYEKSVAVDTQRSASWLFLAKAYLDKYHLFHNPRDFYLGRKAIHWAEETGCAYPVVGWLKKEYQKVS